MARISGIDLPRNKKVLFALCYIHGIGQAQSAKILDVCKIDKDLRVTDLTEEDLLNIRTELSDNFLVEGELRAKVGQDIKRLGDIGAYRGTRHKRGLPTRGQNTKNNSRTRKGKKKTVAGKKKAV